ncbi:unnamed protein product [Closterium sp. NIES-54]
MFRPAPRADPPANSISGRTHPSRSGGVAGDPGPSTQCAAETNMQVFGSLPITLPPFIHGKKDVSAWLLMMTDLFKAHKVHDDARVDSATTVLDQNAQQVVYGSKIQAEADRKPFGWEEFASALKQAFQVQPTQLEVRSRLEKLQCRNRTVQQYSVEFQEIWVLQKPAKHMSEGENIHLFFKGLPEHLQSMHMTDGAGELWRREMKNLVKQGNEKRSRPHSASITSTSRHSTPSAATSSSRVNSSSVSSSSSSSSSATSASASAANSSANSSSVASSSSSIARLRWVSSSSSSSAPNTTSPTSSSTPGTSNSRTSSCSTSGTTNSSNNSSTSSSSVSSGRVSSSGSSTPKACALRNPHAQLLRGERLWPGRQSW